MARGVHWSAGQLIDILSSKEARVVLGRFRDSGHLIRPAVVALAGLAAFIVIRNVVVPKAFGQLGHYRPAALELNMNKPLSYAGQQECVLCHDAQAEVRKAGKHARVSCEACHGPQVKHASASDPGAMKPALPDVATLCKRCHEKDAARPKRFPQVITAEHSNGMRCNECHKPHNPHI